MVAYTLIKKERKKGDHKLSSVFLFVCFCFCFCFFFFSFCILTFLPKANNFLVINIAGNGYAKGSIEGISTSSATDKVWLVAQALGDIAFAYPYSLIVIEIQV